MKDNQTLNLPVTAGPAEAEHSEAAADIGKFKDVQTLYKAYQALEAEFTRRSQRLKELEASKEHAAPAEAAIGTSPSREAIGEEGRGQNALQLSEDVKNAVIEEYLNGVFASRGVPFVTGGGAVAAKRQTPRTMKEAGALAGRLFNNKEDN